MRRGPPCMARRHRLHPALPMHTAHRRGRGKRHRAEKGKSPDCPIRDDLQTVTPVVGRQTDQTSSVATAAIHRASLSHARSWSRFTLQRGGAPPGSGQAPVRRPALEDGGPCASDSPTESCPHSTHCHRQTSDRERAPGRRVRRSRRSAGDDHGERGGARDPATSRDLLWLARHSCSSVDERRATGW